MSRFKYTADELKNFVVESNRIEGIIGAAGLKPSRKFLELERLTVDDLCEFVWDTAGKRLRVSPGMNVRVGDHHPPPGGPQIRLATEILLETVVANVDPPFTLHCHYETLHPFMDGNGRSGRILWAWQMIHHDIAPRLKLGFLHAFYYQTLEVRQEKPNA